MALRRPAAEGDVEGVACNSGTGTTSRLSAPALAFHVPKNDAVSSPSSGLRSTTSGRGVVGEGRVEICGRSSVDSALRYSVCSRGGLAGGVALVNGRGSTGGGGSSFLTLRPEVRRLPGSDLPSANASTLAPTSSTSFSSRPAPSTDSRSDAASSESSSARNLEKWARVERVVSKMSRAALRTSVVRLRRMSSGSSLSPSSWFCSCSSSTLACSTPSPPSESSWGLWSSPARSGETRSYAGGWPKTKLNRFVVVGLAVSPPGYSGKVDATDEMESRGV